MIFELDLDDYARADGCTRADGYARAYLPGLPGLCGKALALDIKWS